jgi:hypothetical protein
MAAGIGAVVLAASTPNWLLLCVRRFGTSWRQMRGGGEGAEGEIGAGGEVFCSMQFLASIDHGGFHCPTAAMRPNFRRRSIQQSANMLGNKLVSLKLKKFINSNVY